MTHPTPILKRRGVAATVALLALFAVAAPSHAQFGRRGPDRELSKGAEAVKDAFRDVVGDAGQSTVLILSDGEETALGTVVEADGLIITKASEIKGKPTVQLRRTAPALAATVVGVSEDHDLALLRVDVPDLTPIAWADPAKAQVGQWVASAFASDTPVAVGVLSVGRRKIPGRSGLLGVMLADGEGGAKIAQVLPESPAEKVGLRVDDVITKVNGKPVGNREQLVAEVRKYQPGQEVRVTYKRLGKVPTTRPTTGPAAATAGTKTDEQDNKADEEPKPAVTEATAKESELRVKLVGNVGAPSRADLMNTMGGPLSERNANFPAVLQHDTVLLPKQVGGPLVTLDGKAIGINIARAGRVESYALPADVVQAAVKELKAGKGAPTTAPAARAAEKASDGK